MLGAGVMCHLFRGSTFNSQHPPGHSKLSVQKFQRQPSLASTGIRHAHGVQTYKQTKHAYAYNNFVKKKMLCLRLYCKIACMSKQFVVPSPILPSTPSKSVTDKSPGDCSVVKNTHSTNMRTWVCFSQTNIKCQIQPHNAPNLSTWAGTGDKNQRISRPYCHQPSRDSG